MTEPRTAPSSTRRERADAIALRRLSGASLGRALPDLARLRTRVFRAWPYLYEGTETYERAYLARFAAASGAVIIAAFVPDGAEGEQMVGAATACPLMEADPAFAAPFEKAGMDPEEWFYFGESVLSEPYRGRGIGVAFFAERETAAREQGFARICFCAVERDRGDPRRPPDHVALDGFWSRRGYARLGLAARYAWQDVGDTGETFKPMAFWGRTLDE